MRDTVYQDAKQPKDKFWGRLVGHQGPTRWDIPDPGPGMSQTKTLCKAPFSVVLGRDGPTTTTTIIFQKSFASDATPKRHLMAHQMKNLCSFSVFHCVKEAIGASSGGTPKMKNGAPRDEQKMVVVVVGPSPILDREWPGCPAIWVGTSRECGAPGVKAMVDTKRGQDKSEVQDDVVCTTLRQEKGAQSQTF